MGMVVSRVAWLSCSLVRPVFSEPKSRAATRVSSADVTWSAVGSEAAGGGLLQREDGLGERAFADGGGGDDEGAVGDGVGEGVEAAGVGMTAARRRRTCLASSWAASKGAAKSLTTRRSEKPKSCMARAAAPMLCGLRAPTRTTVKRARAAAESIRQSVEGGA